jgi:hypothetical protein
MSRAVAAPDAAGRHRVHRAPGGWFHRPDLKLSRLATFGAFARLRHGALVTLGSIVDELDFPAGSTLVDGGLLSTEALLLLHQGDRVLDARGTWTVPACGLSIGLDPWLDRAAHPATILAGTDVVAYVVPGPAVRLLLELVPSPAWSTFEGHGRTLATSTS